MFIHCKISKLKKLNFAIVHLSRQLQVSLVAIESNLLDHVENSMANERERDVIPVYGIV